MVEVTMNALQEMRKLIEEGDVDVLRTMVKQMAEALMGAEVDALCGAAHGERHPERTNQRNGYRARPWDTRSGTIDLALPKLREGSYFPDWLLTPRRRSEQALTAVIADAYLAGVSTRRVDKLVRSLGIEGISKSQVSRLAASLDEVVEAFRNRPLQGPYPYLSLDALAVKVREAGRICSVACVHAVGVSADGRRESLGLELVTSEDGAGWTAFLRGLVARGLGGRAARDQRRPPGPHRRHRRHPAGGELAALPHALHAQPPDARAQERAAVRGHPRALDLRPARRVFSARAA